MSTRRLRIIAGPNGSGKSSVFPMIQERVRVGRYVNPDELEALFRATGAVDLTAFGLNPDPDDLGQFLVRNGGFLKLGEAAGEPITLHQRGSTLMITNREHTGYTAAVAAAYIRERLVDSGQSFAFESVLSDPRKIHEIEAAKGAGYRIYLYFVGTGNPDINVARVANRVLSGGHAVLEAKIRKRYELALGNLLPAFLLADRAYIFDNSREEMELILEADDRGLVLRGTPLPAWVDDSLLIPLRNLRGGQTPVDPGTASDRSHP
jgi:predicted ABC-type ATPase